MAPTNGHRPRPRLPRRTAAASEAAVTRMVRIRLTLQTPQGYPVLRADTVVDAAHLAQLVPVVPEPGQQGRWAFNLRPDSDTGGQLLLEILG